MIHYDNIFIFRFIGLILLCIKYTLIASLVNLWWQELIYMYTTPFQCAFTHGLESVTNIYKYIYKHLHRNVLERMTDSCALQKAQVDGIKFQNHSRLAGIGCNIWNRLTVAWPEVNGRKEIWIPSDYKKKI